jgi:hypothetical protein
MQFGLNVPHRTRLSRKAILSLYLGIATLPVGLCLVGPGRYVGIPVFAVVFLSTVVLGVLSAIEINRSKGRLTGKGIGEQAIALALIGLVIGIFAPVVIHSRYPRDRMRSSFNLHQLAVAIHNFRAAEGHFPHDICDSQGRPLLSWRVSILPYVESDELYKQFNLREAWDSAHNKPLLAKMPFVFLPSGPVDRTDQTYYQAFVGAGTAFERADLSFEKDFPDGTSKTAMLAEAWDSVPWTKPSDLVYKRDQPLPALGGVFKPPGWLGSWRQVNGFHLTFVDGHTQFFEREKIDEPTLRALITRNGGENFPAP